MKPKRTTTEQIVRECFGNSLFRDDKSGDYLVFYLDKDWSYIARAARRFVKMENAENLRRLADKSAPGSLVRDLIYTATQVLHHDDDVLEGTNKECVYMRTRLTFGFLAVLQKHRKGDWK
jgi:hypothetical protein